MNSPSSPTMRRFMHSHSDVCIVGNGAIAKTTALALAQAGQSVTLLSPASAPANGKPEAEASWDVRVYALNHTAHQLLSSLKEWGALEAESVAQEDGMMVNGEGEKAGG